MPLPSGWRTDLSIGWKNLFRNPKRTALACLAIAIAQTTLIFLNSFINGYTSILFEKMTGPLVGHFQIHAPKWRDDEAVERVIDHPASMEKDLLRQDHVRRVSSRVYAPVLVSVKEEGHVARLTGVVVSREIETGGLLEGLSPDQVPQGQEVLIGKGLATDMGVKAGDTLALMGQSADGSVASGLYPVKAVVETSLDQLNQVGLVMNLPVAQEFLGMGDQVHEMVLYTDGVGSIPGVLAALKRLPSLRSLEILSWDQLVPSLATMLKMVDKSNLIILVLVFLATVAGVANTMLMATFERSHEFGMLLALGCRPGRLIRIMAFESVMLGLLGALLGTILGLGLTWYGIHFGWDLSTLGGSQKGVSLNFEGIHADMVMHPILKAKDVLDGIAAVCVTSLLASLWPARRISRLDPVEAMRS